MKRKVFIRSTFRFVPVACGVKTLVAGCVIEDKKVSTQDLEDKIAAFEDYVQSVDIVAFQELKDNLS